SSSPAIDVGRAGIVGAVRHRVVGPARSALEQGREQIFRSSTGASLSMERLPYGGGLPCRLLLALLHPIPQPLVHDPAHFRLLDDHPFALWARLAGNSAGVRVLHPLTSIPAQATDVDLVVEYAGLVLHVAIDGRCCPGLAAR